MRLPRYDMDHALRCISLNRNAGVLKAISARFCNAAFATSVLRSKKSRRVSFGFHDERMEYGR